MKKYFRNFKSIIVSLILALMVIIAPVEALAQGQVDSKELIKTESQTKNKGDRQKRQMDRCPRCGAEERRCECTSVPSMGNAGINFGFFSRLNFKGFISVNAWGSNRPTYSSSNSYYKSNSGQHAFVYDEDGKLSYDISRERIKMFYINVLLSGTEYFRSEKLPMLVPQWLIDILGLH